MQNNSLIKYGLDSFFTKNLSLDEVKNLGKIIAVHKKNFKVINTKGFELNAIAKGSLVHYKSTNTSQLPKLGDFVILESNNGENTYIKYILPRKNELKRKIVGEKKEDQIIATNIDYAFITVSCDEQFNIRKLERMVLACKDSKIEPIVVITKVDLDNEVNQKINTINERFLGIKIITTFYLQIESINPIKNLLTNNKVGAFIGSSGSGKSTLTNMLIEKNYQKTASVSNLDKGKHTTTHREMFILAEGGCIIDNPGIKEFALWLNNEESIEDNFLQILNLAKLCKFRNCTHNKEPNCAVQKALLEGSLSLDVYNNYKKIKQEEEETKITKKQNEKKRDKKIIKNYKVQKKLKKINQDYL